MPDTCIDVRDPACNVMSLSIENFACLSIGEWHSFSEGRCKFLYILPCWQGNVQMAGPYPRGSGRTAWPSGSMRIFAFVSGPAVHWKMLGIRSTAGAWRAAVRHQRFGWQLTTMAHRNLARASSDASDRSFPSAPRVGIGAVVLRRSPKADGTEVNMADTMCPLAAACMMHGAEYSEHAQIGKF